MNEKTLIDCATENAAKIATAGTRAIEQARAAGAPSYYMDPALCDGIIREMPDGSRQEIEVTDGEDIVLQELPPAL